MCRAGRTIGATAMSEPSPALRRRALRFIAGLATSAWWPGCASGALPQPGAANGSAVPATGGALEQVAVHVARDASVQRLDSRFAGLSYEKGHLASGLFTAADTSLVAFFTRLGPGLLRLGGNSVDRVHWSPDATAAGPDVVSRGALDALAGFLRATGWQVLYGINLASNTPERAAAEAADAAAVLGPSLYGFEIGNECDLYRYNGLRPSSYRYEDFLAEWRDYRRAIVERHPDAPMTGPASSFDIAAYTLPFARDEGASLKLLTHHYYRADGLDAGSDVELMLSPDHALAGQLPQLVEGARAARIAAGVRIAEANSFYHEGSPGVSDSYGAALWTLGFLFENALAGCSGVNLHGGGLTKSYTPLADDGQRVIAVRPEFYGLYLFSQAARGRLVRTASAPDLARFSAYAVLWDDGSTALVLVNTHPVRAVLAAVDPGTACSRIELTELNGPALTQNEGVTLNGSPIDRDGQWHPAAARSAPVERDGRAKLEVAARSALLARFIE